jgi:hypothetical protein
MFSTHLNRVPLPTSTCMPSGSKVHPTDVNAVGEITSDDI